MKTFSVVLHSLPRALLLSSLASAVFTPGALAYFPHLVCSGDGIAVELKQSQFEQKKFDLAVFSDKENPSYQAIVPGDVDATIAALESSELSVGQWETRRAKPIAAAATPSFAFKINRRVFSTVVSWEAWDESLVGRLEYNESDPMHSSLVLGKRTRCKGSPFTISTSFHHVDGPPDFICWGWNVRVVSTGATQAVSCKLAKSLDPSVWHPCHYDFWRGTNICPRADLDAGLWPDKRGLAGLKLAEERRADGGLVIAEVLPSGAAEQAGLKAGDVVTALKSEPAAPWVSAVGAALTLKDFALLIQGAPGTPVSLRVSSEGSAIAREVALVRKSTSQRRSGD